MMRRSLTTVGVSSAMRRVILPAASSSMAIGATAPTSETTTMSYRFHTSALDVRAPHNLEQFAYGMNGPFMDDLLKLYQEDKTKVDKSWHGILENLAGASPDQALIESFTRPSTIAGRRDSAATAKECADNMKLAWMVRAYEMKGHLVCPLDPLGMFHADLDGSIPEELEPTFFGFSPADMEMEFKVNVGPNFGGLVTQGSTPMKLREIVALLTKTYCSNVGIEFMHAGFQDTRMWFRDQLLKTAGKPPAELRRQTLTDLIHADRFEKFLHLKYQTHKRFGLDGGESFVASMNAIMNYGVQLGVEHYVIGMAHRGRLNVLANVCGKTLKKIFNEFEGRTEDSDCPGMSAGDVKYHLGLTNTITTANGQKCGVSLLANPSHLECVNPLVLGRVRAKQGYAKDEKREKFIPVLVHGDAAFSGQGVCYESMGLTALENHDVGGTVHVVINNQIGFTSYPMESRSASYCTDLAKVVSAPVFHVNGDDPDEVVRVSRIAMAYRQQFKKDVIVDLVCYRRYGHNETDQPKFTQPLMYAKIEKMVPVLKSYAETCINDGVISQSDYDKEVAEFDAKLRDAFDQAHTAAFEAKAWDESPAHTYTSNLELSKLRETGVTADNLREIGLKLTKIPEGFKAHPKVKAVIDRRRESVQKGEQIDWGLAEQLAFATLACEGVHVRLIGQDVERGTFAQRHCKYHEMNTGAAHLPLAHIDDHQAQVTVANSSLSEFGVCGYECGYAMENPKSVVIWEAQFGDFANGAQVIFDQFLASGETKWIRQCNLVVSLPHGYDGQGPEHSSGRIERFLQLSDCPDSMPADFDPANWQHLCEKRIKEQNWQVCYPTTSANCYHAFRRQVHREFRKPLINFFSKNLLRNPVSLSTFHEMRPGTTITCVFDHHVEIENPRKIVFCTGQVYGKLLEAMKKDEAKNGNVALVRLEQLAPFCWEPIHDVIAKYRAKAGADIPVVWAQEEPKNMGAWSFVRVRMNNLLKFMNYNGRATYVGRPASASPAPGHGFIYNEEEKNIADGVFA